MKPPIIEICIFLLLSINAVVSDNIKSNKEVNDSTSKIEIHVEHGITTVEKSDSPEDNDDDDEIIYVCGNDDTESKCTCINETLNCRGSMWSFFSSNLEHAKIKISNNNFTLKTADFTFASIGSLKKDEILPGQEATIKILIFQSNSLKNIENGTFNKFTSLKTLDFQRNALTTFNENILSSSLGSTLLVLDLSYNKLRNLPSSVFQNMKNLETLYLSYNKKINLCNKINGINVTVFSEALSNLKDLWLIGCNIVNVEDNTFINLKNLERLHLNANPLTNIPQGINKLSNLIFLDFSKTQIKSIKNCDFCNLPKLIYLDFFDCAELSYIHENAFGAISNMEKMPNLKYFLIENCKVEIIPKKLVNWKKVSRIEINGNPIICNCSMAWLINNITTPEFVLKLRNRENLYSAYDLQCYNPPELFGIYMHHTTGEFCLNETTIFEDESKDVYYVCGEQEEEDYIKRTACTCLSSTLDCTNNMYKKINHTNFKILKTNFTAEIVALSDNNITALKKGELLPGYEKNVKELYLRSNNISMIENGIFVNFTSLKVLKLNSNSIESIDDGVFSKEMASNLLELDLNSNKLRLTSIKTFENLVNLTTLCLSANLNILSNGGNIFARGLSKLQKLDLHNCNISSLNEDVFSNLTSLNDLLLSNNPITSIPTAINKLKNLQHLEIIDTNILELNNHGLEVNENFELLSAMLSKIQRIDDCAFCNFPNLKYINLNLNSHLSYIDENAFGFAKNNTKPKIKTFLASRCNISTLSEKLLNWENVTKIYIQSNPFTCNCSMAWLINDFNATTPLYINKLKDHFNKSYVNEMFCHSPLELYGTHLSSLSGDFCINETTKMDFSERKDDENYYVCGDKDNQMDNYCSCDNAILRCFELNHTNIQIRNRTIRDVIFSFENIDVINMDNFLLGQEKNMESLHLVYENISKIENGTLDKFVSLKELTLYGNMQTALDENVLTENVGSTLEKLYVHFLTLLSPSAFMHLTKLEKLSLQRNPNLSEFFSSFIFPVELENLHILLLEECNISSLHEDAFMNLRNLTHLYLWNNPLTSLPSSIKYLSNLNTIDLGYTSITILHQNQFKHNFQLHTFKAINSSIQRIEDCAFCNLTKLGKIEFENSQQLSYVHENAFGAVSNNTPLHIDLLSFFNCNLTSIPEKFDRLKIHQFSYRHNPFHCNCSMAWLLKKLIIGDKKFHDKITTDLCKSPPELQDISLSNLTKFIPSCDETMSSTTISTTVSTVIVTAAIVESYSNATIVLLILVILFVIIAIGVAIWRFCFPGVLYYFQNRNVDRFKRNQDDDEDLIEEDFDTA